jgi:A/G-specific adenine glycosylase
LALSIMSGERIEAIQRGLLSWFRANARDLPWRRTRDPYAILVSEVMLQQTQVDRVLPYYQRFLERFPTVAELASAPTAEVIRIWSGLGYNRRAVNLQRAARAVCDDFDGVFPSDPEQLRALPGIGAYTAGAISAFAFEKDVAFTDTNMRRVIGRLIFGDRPAIDRQILDAAQRLVPPDTGWEWNQALIEFGALQCTARKPACIICPLREVCLAYPTMQTQLAAQRGRTRRTQSAPFETTTRYYRGRIVEELRALPAGEMHGIDLAELGPRVRKDYSESDLPWLQGLIAGLQRDGLAVIAEESPAYDAPAERRSTTGRVRLP